MRVTGTKELQVFGIFIVKFWSQKYGTNFVKKSTKLHNEISFFFTEYEPKNGNHFPLPKECSVLPNC